MEKCGESEHMVASTFSKFPNPGLRGTLVPYLERIVLGVRIVLARFSAKYEDLCSHRCGDAGLRLYWRRLKFVQPPVI